MDIRFVTAGSGDVVAVMAGEGGQLFPAAQALDAATGGRITKAMQSIRFSGGLGSAIDVLAPEGVDFARVLVIGIGKPERADLRDQCVGYPGDHPIRHSCAEG